MGVRGGASIRGVIANQSTAKVIISAGNHAGLPEELLLAGCRGDGQTAWRGLLRYCRRGALPRAAVRGEEVAHASTESERV